MCVFQVIARCVENGLVLPVFKNLLNLSFGSYNERGWNLLPYLLQQSPKVETLIIEGLDGGYIGNVTIGLFHVKELHVVGYKGTAKELLHLKSLLAGTECIPKVRLEFPEDVVVDTATIIQTHRDLFTLVGVVSIDVVIARCVEYGLVLPVFKNLLNLSFGSCNEIGWKLLPYLIKQTPKLEILIIQGLDGYGGDLTIRPFQGKVEELVKHLKSFLG
ncbi:unnamed protein product [Brassica rapa subsp. trilocularis]